MLDLAPAVVRFHRHSTNQCAGYCSFYSDSDQVGNMDMDSFVKQKHAKTFIITFVYGHLGPLFVHYIQ